MTPLARALRTAAPFVAVPAVLFGLILALVAGPVIGVIAFVVVGAALALWVRLAGDSRVIASVGGREADPRAHARLCNLVEGLSISAGVKQPKLVVIDSPGLNAMSAGSKPSRGIVGVTSGLLEELDRIELEAVLAEELVQIRRHETFPATVLVATFGVGRSQAIPADRDTEADRWAVGLTRYPPALASALEKIEAKGSAVEGQTGYTSHLWLADPRGSKSVSKGRIPLPERIEALREL